MKTLKNILFVIVVTLLTTSCTDTTEDLKLTHNQHTLENVIASGNFDTGGDDKGTSGTGKDRD